MQKVTPTNINDATPPQRRAFATNFLNLDLAADATDDQVFNAIRTAQPGSETIFVAEDEQAERQFVAQAQATAASPVDAPVAGQGQVGTLGRDDPRATIHIPVSDSDDETGSAPVELGVNGRAWQLSRGVNINVPWRVVEALEHAVTEVVRHNPDTGDETRRNAIRFPFHFVDKPSPEAVAAWHERTDSQFCA